MILSEQIDLLKMQVESLKLELITIKSALDAEAPRRDARITAIEESQTSLQARIIRLEA